MNQKSIDNVEQNSLTDYEDDFTEVTSRKLQRKNSQSSSSFPSAFARLVKGAIEN